jgi:exodeoxyribonuclease VII small subunit
MDEALKVFEEGIRLSRFCTMKLDEAEKKVETLLADEDGNLKSQPFEIGDQGDEED